MNKKQKEQAESVAILKKWGVVDGTIIYAKITKQSASGMSRRISLYFVDKTDSNIINISYHAARTLGWPYHDGFDGGVRVRGCGMDMLYHTVECLSSAMGYGKLNQAHKDDEIERNETRHTGLRYRSM